MKELSAKTSKRSIKNRVLSAIVVLTAIYLSTMACYCDAFDAAGEAANNLKTKFVEVAEKLFPLSMVILIIAILITHDQKMMTMELKVGAGLCVAYIALRIVNSDAFMETFTNLGVDGMNVPTKVNTVVTAMAATHPPILMG